MHKHYSIISTFKERPIEAFVYPAKKFEKSTVIILKGLYGLHDPQRTDSWERGLIDARNDNYTFICINTARLFISEPESKEAFVGKKFKEECADIEKIFDHLILEGVIVDTTPLFFVGHSFGGTTLLGLPALIQKSTGIVMVASGCGKSETTDKPLLESLYDEDHLLGSIKEYSGVFMYLRGGNDVVVPRTSQNKIIESAMPAKVRVVADVLGGEHNLIPTNPAKGIARSLIFATALDMVVSLGSN